MDLRGLVATSSFRHNGKDLFPKNLSGCLDANERNYSYLIAQRWDLNTIIKRGSKPDKMDSNKLLARGSTKKNRPRIVFYILTIEAGLTD